MRNILSKNKGASMLLAICIFMFLVVLGFNVLAAASSNINNTSEQFENEQAMQYVNSIYEIVDGMIRAGEFDLSGMTNGTQIDVTADGFRDKNNINNINNQIDVNIKFKMINSKIEAKIKITYNKRAYTVTSIYGVKNNLDDGTMEYRFEICKGVESLEE